DGRRAVAGAAAELSTGGRVVTGMTGVGEIGLPSLSFLFSVAMTPVLHQFMFGFSIRHASQWQYVSATADHVRAECPYRVAALRHQFQHRRRLLHQSQLLYLRRQWR